MLKKCIAYDKIPANGVVFVIGYVFLAIFLLAGATKGYCGKKTSGFLEEYSDAMFINFVRMLFCVVIGFLVMVAQNNLGELKIDFKTLIITLCSGVTTSIFVVTWLISVKRGAYMMLDVFLLIGVAVPIIGSFILYGEPVSLKQFAGFAILFVAVLLMCSYNNSIKEKITVSSLCLLLICGLINGVTDFSQKIFIEMSESANVAIFNFYTYIFSSVTLLVFYLIFKSKNKPARTENKGLLKKIFLYVCVMSTCLYLSSYFKTLSALYIPSATLYPLSQGLALVLSTFMSAIFFKEKLTSKCISGVILTFISLLLIK